MVDKNLVAKIAIAIDNSEYKWRTSRSIAREIHVDEQPVSSALSDSSIFLKAKRPNLKGEALYTTLEKYRRETPFLERLLSAAANTVTE